MKPHWKVLGVLALALAVGTPVFAADPIVLTPASAAAQNIKLTPTVGVDIIKMTKNPDGTLTCLFQWNDKEGRPTQRAVIANKDTVIGVTGKVVPFEKLDESMMRHKVVATVAADMETAVSMRFGREMIHLSRDELTPKQIAALMAAAPVATAASNEALDKRVAEIVGALRLNSKEREARLTTVIAGNLRAIRDTHNAGFAPESGTHEKLLAGLAKDLTPEQTEIVKDRLTIGKLPFTYNAYHDIVSDLTLADDTFILAKLRQAREESLDVKNPDEMNPIFEKYKTEIETYLDAHGHNWKASRKAFTDAQNAAKAQSTTRPGGN